MARRRLELERQRDFTGGLNLNDDIYNLNVNETFDLQNVDIDRRGGFGIRRGQQLWHDVPTNRIITATGASRTGNVVTATGLSPVNGDPGGLVPGQQITVDFADNTYDGTFIVSTAVGGASTATWAQTAADDASAGAGTITEGYAPPDSGWTYKDNSAVYHELIARGGWVKRWTGSVWADVLINTGNGRTMFMEMNNVLYILKPGTVPAYRWTGAGLATTLVTVAGNFNDDLTAPNDGNFPACVAMCVHHQVAWAGNTNEGGTAFHSRVRWSHPGRPEDWRTNDFIDIDADDENGEIRALIPFGDRLLVFKDKAVYAIHGYPPAGFSVQNLTKELGAPLHWAIKATEDAVYFWDVDKGLWKYDGKKFEWVFEPLWPLIEDNRLNMPFSFQTIVEFHKDRVWVSAPWLGEPYPAQIVGLVYAPNVGKRGAWTIHTRTAFGWWIHRGSEGGDVHLLGGQNLSVNGLVRGYVIELDTEGIFTDVTSSVGASPVQIPIEAWYTTRWFDATNSAMKKRWKRPVVVMRGGQEQRTIVEVLTDYNPAHVVKSFDLITTPDPNEGEWDVDDWDETQWAATPGLGGDRAIVLRGAPLGPGVAKALRFKNTVAGQDWRVLGLTMKWIPRTIRN